MKLVSCDDKKNVSGVQTSEKIIRFKCSQWKCRVQKEFPTKHNTA